MSALSADVLCSLGTKPSTTDPVTNVIRLESLRLVRNLRHLLAGKLPGECLPALLHEGMHHWCFITPLGHALALLDLRARTEFISAKETRNQEQLRQAFDYRACFEVLNTVLRPLAEGLATMWQLDAIIDETRARYVGALTNWTLALTCRDVPWQEKPRAFSTLFEANILAQDGIESRMTLLRYPFDCGSCGGYLPGYMCLRNLWLRADEVNQDIGQFLSVVRYAVYHDPVLIGLATSGSHKPPELPRAALMRLKQLLSPSNLAQQAGELTMSWEQGEVFTFADLSSVKAVVQNPPEDPPLWLVQSDRRMSMLALAELFEQVTAASLSETIRNFNEAVLKRREWFWLGSEIMDIKVDHGVLWARVEAAELGGFPIWAGVAQLHPGIQFAPGEYQGRVDLLFSLAGTKLVRCVSMGGELISITHSGIDNMGTAEQLNRLVLGRDDLDASEREIRNTLVKDADHDGELSSLRDATYAETTQAFASFVLGNNSHGEAEGLLTELGKDGWYQALGEDERKLKALALKSACVTLGLPQSEVKEVFGNHGINESELAPILPILDRLGGRCLIARAAA